MGVSRITISLPFSQAVSASSRAPGCDTASSKDSTSVESSRPRASRLSPARRVATTASEGLTTPESSSASPASSVSPLASERPMAPCGSRSASSVRRPRSARATARFSATVVLPTPPFWLAITSRRAIHTSARAASVALPALWTETTGSGAGWPRAVRARAPGQASRAARGRRRSARPGPRAGSKGPSTSEYASIQWTRKSRSAEAPDAPRAVVQHEIDGHRPLGQDRARAGDVERQDRAVAAPVALGEDRDPVRQIAARRAGSRPSRPRDRAWDRRSGSRADGCIARRAGRSDGSGGA